MNFRIDSHDWINFGKSIEQRPQSSFGAKNREVTNFSLSDWAAVVTVTTTTMCGKRYVHQKKDGQMQTCIIERLQEVIETLPNNGDWTAAETITLSQKSQCVSCLLDGSYATALV